MAQRYDISTDTMVEVTDLDIERWKNADAFAGVRIVMTRALIEAERQVWNGQIEWNALNEIKNSMLALLHLNENGK